MKVQPFALLLSLLLAVSGCTHAMHVRNLDAYVKNVPAERRAVIALEDRSTSPDEHEYFVLVHEALATHPGVAAVVPASPAPDDPVPDVAVGVHPRVTYHGSWWNYPITFPGFLLFTHAWNGYVYSAALETQITMAGDGVPLATREVPTRYDMRHCSFKRGALASSGWYTPGWGGLNAIFGFFMVPYDASSTPEFRKEVRAAYGRYIADSIVEMVNSAQARRDQHTPSAARRVNPSRSAGSFSAARDT